MRFKQSGKAAIFNLMRPVLLIVALLALTGFKWPGPTDGPMVFGVPAFIPGYLVGTVLMVMVPYAKEVFQRVGESGDWSNVPRFDWRYLAFFVLPVLGAMVSFLTVDGLWETAHTWRFVPTISMAYFGENLAKDVGKTGIAIYNAMSVARRARRMNRLR